MADRLGLVRRSMRGSNPYGVMAKLLLHWDRLNRYLTEDDTTPVMCELNLTNRCNLNCERCISANMRSGDSLPLDSAVRFVDQFADIGGKGIIFSGGGEPTVHPYFEQVARRAVDAGLDIGLMTNGAYRRELNEPIGSMFRWVRISLDRRRRGDYAAHKGVDVLDRVLENIEDLRQYDARVVLNVNVDMEQTIRQTRLTIKELLHMVDGIQFRPMLPRPFAAEEPEVNELVWGYLLSLEPSEQVPISQDKLDDIRLRRFHPFAKCDGHMFLPIVNANGDLCVCMYQTLDQRFVFGNVIDDDLDTIWRSERRREVIEFVRGIDFAAAGCQPCCKLTEINKALSFLRYDERPRDVNFL